MRTQTKQELIELLKSRDGDSCFICRKPFEEEQPTIDHWVPKAVGGSDEIDNLRITHRKCNTEKADRIPNQDGTLPPKRPNGLDRNRMRRLNKKKLKESICRVCDNGRKLAQSAKCRTCGSLPGPEHYPHYLKRASHKCDHNINWCWACSIGIVDRKPVLDNLITG